MYLDLLLHESKNKWYYLSMDFKLKDNQKFDVVGLGACGVDLHIQVPILPKPGDKVTSDKSSVSFGGVTANNLIQAAKLGLSTAWIGSLGNDDWGKKLIEDFENNTIISFPIVIDTPTQQFYIITDTSETMMIGLPGVTKKLTADDIKKILPPIIAGAQHFHTEVAMIPLEVALAGAEIAQQNKVKVLLDIDGNPDYLINNENLGTKEELRTLLKNTNVVKLSPSAASGLLKEQINANNIQELLEFGPQLAVVTLAEKGCLLADENKVVQVEGFSVKPIDTAGAGDAFMGGLSYGLLQEWDLKKVGQFANACGAYKATKLGTRSSGTLQEIEQFIQACTID